MATPTVVALPARGERNALKFDLKFEEQLPTFFNEFESAATKAAITADDATMKKEVLRYVNGKTNHFWRSLSSFSAVDKT